MSTAFRIKSAPLPLSLQRVQFWNYLAVITQGKRYRDTEEILSENLKPGQQIRATDRVYEVQRDGSWRVVKMEEGKSDIYVPGWFPKNKYDGRNKGPKKIQQRQAQAA